MYSSQSLQNPQLRLFDIFAFGTGVEGNAGFPVGGLGYPGDSESVGCCSTAQRAANKLVNVKNESQQGSVHLSPYVTQGTSTWTENDLGHTQKSTFISSHPDLKGVGDQRVQLLNGQAKRSEQAADVQQSLHEKQQWLHSQHSHQRQLLVQRQQEQRPQQPQPYQDQSQVANHRPFSSKPFSNRDGLANCDLGAAGPALEPQLTPTATDFSTSQTVAHAPDSLPGATASLPLTSSNVNRHMEILAAAALASVRGMGRTGVQG
jgi:hypothetical protein